MLTWILNLFRTVHQVGRSHAKLLSDYPGATHGIRHGDLDGAASREPDPITTRSQEVRHG